MASPKAHADGHAKAHAVHDDDDHGGGDHGGGDHGGGHCPPPWIITFADMVTLLMAFFVIMLQSSKPDVPKFNAFAAALQQTFGIVPDASGGNGIMNGGSTILDYNQGLEEAPPPEDPNGEKPQSEGDGPGKDGAGGSSDAGGNPDANPNAIAEALKQAVAQGEITIDGAGGPVVIKVPEGKGKDAAKELASALAKALGAEGAGGNGAAGAAAGGAADGAATGQSAEAAAASLGEGAQANGTPGAGGEGGGPETAKRMAEIANARLSVSLSDAVAKGLVDVEQRDGKVFVSVGSGGAFGSGSADMTAEAQQIMDSLVRAASTSSGQITVTGHTDNVPISGGEFKDNWELAAARAASVVRAIAADGRIDPSRLVAMSKGDTAPIADNATEEGRAKNRRIEITIDYEGATPPAGN
jgi:chemotaxis protein MotB